MVLDQIWVGPNMGPTKYAGPNLVRPKMADQKCLDQIWLDTINRYFPIKGPYLLTLDDVHRNRTSDA